MHLFEPETPRRRRKKSFWQRFKIPLIISICVVLTIGGVYLILSALNDQSTSTSHVASNGMIDVMATNEVRLTEEAGRSSSSTAIPFSNAESTLAPTSSSVLVSAVPPNTDRLLLDIANGKLTDENSFNYNINIDIAFSIGAEMASVSLRGNGGISGLSTSNSINDVVMGFSFEGIVNNNGAQQPIEGGFIFKEGFLYQYVVDSTLASGVAPTWSVIALDDALDSMMGMELASLDGTNIEVPRINSDELPDLQLFMDQLDLAEFSTFNRVTRGQNADFNTSIDLMGYLRSPKFITMLSALDTSALGLSQTELEELSMAMPFIMSQLISELSLSTLQRVDIDRQRVNELQLELVLRLPADTLGLNTVPNDIAELVLNIDVFFSNHGGIIDIDAPENAVPIELILQ